MKLKDLQQVIYADLNIIYNGFTYKDVFKLGGVFYNLKDKEVIGIRADKDHVLISVR